MAAIRCRTGELCQQLDAFCPAHAGQDMIKEVADIAKG